MAVGAPEVGVAIATSHIPLQYEMNGDHITENARILWEHQ